MMSTPPLKPKRSRPGRSSRRRKRKARSILDAAASLVEADAKSSAPDVPADRHITLEGVKIRRKEFRRNNDEDGSDDSLDRGDEQQLTSQLGFLPGNAVCVAARLSAEFSQSTTPKDQSQQLHAPSVVKLYPMVIRDSYHGGKTDGRKFKGRRRGGMRTVDTKSVSTSDATKEVNNSVEENAEDFTDQLSKERCWFIDSGTTNRSQIIEPFPTLYWLTSPILRSHISQIELSKTHGVQMMEQRLKSSTHFLEQMARAHNSYGEARWALLTDIDKEEVLKRGWGDALGVGRGVAGIRPKKSKDVDGNDAETWDGIKCLHAHAAHYLAQVEEWRVLANAKNDTDDLLNLIRKCDGNDINLVGKWTIEAVLELVQQQL